MPARQTAARREDPPRMVKRKPKPTPKVTASSVPGTEPLAVKPNEAAKLIGVGKNVLYRLLASGDIRRIKLGHTRLVPLSELRAWIAREIESQGGVMW